MRGSLLYRGDDHGGGRAHHCPLPWFRLGRYSPGARWACTGWRGCGAAWEFRRDGGAPVWIRDDRDRPGT